MNRNGASRDAQRLSPFLQRDFTKRFYHRDPGIVDQNVERIAANLRDQNGHALLGGEIVNQFNTPAHCD